VVNARVAIYLSTLWAVRIALYLDATLEILRLWYASAASRSGCGAEDAASRSGCGAEDAGGNGCILLDRDGTG